MERLRPVDRLIFPLDVRSAMEARTLVEELSGHVGLFKVGLQLFTREGRNVFAQIMSQHSDTKFFLDLKTFDIPNTVAATQRQLRDINAIFLTFPAEQGRTALQSVAANKPNPDTKVLAVTVLTSLDQHDMEEVGVSGSTRDVVLKRAEIARAAGCDGVVCSGQEARAVKDKMGSDFIVVCPGIRPEWARVKNDDQKRTCTPREAIANGADFIVVGRPIRQAEDRVVAARKVVKEIKQGLEDSGRD